MKFTIPSTSDEADERLKKIEMSGIFPLNKLNALKKNINSEDDKKRGKAQNEIIRIFDSDEHGFDDLYKVKILFLNMLFRIKECTSEDDLYRVAVKMKGKINPGLEINDKNDAWLFFMNYQEYLRALFKSEIEARLSLLEYLSYLNPYDLVPRMIDICSFYFECENVQELLGKARYLSIYGFDNEKEKWGKFLKMVFSPDLRKKVSTENDFWIVDILYENAYPQFKTYGKLKKEKKLDKNEFKSFLLNWNIPYEDGVKILSFYSQKGKMRDLFFSYLCEKGHISCYEIYRNRKSKINRMKRKHAKESLSLPILNLAIDCFSRETRVMNNPLNWLILKLDCIYKNVGISRESPTKCTITGQFPEKYMSELSPN